MIVAKRIILLFFAVALVAAAICLLLMRNSQRKGTRDQRIITDLAGRTVALPSRINRLLALGTGSLRLVAYLGATDLVVGREDIESRIERDLFSRPYASRLSEKYFSLPVVGAGGPGALPDPEKILLCRPDVMVVIGIDPAQLENLQARTGVPAVFLTYGEVGVWRNEARRSLQLLSQILDRPKRAEELNNYIASLEEDLQKRTADIAEADRLSVYFGGISYKGARGIDSTQSGYLPARLAGAFNLADSREKPGHYFVDKEQILAWKPDFIFLDRGSRLVLEQDFAVNRAFYRLLSESASGGVFSLLSYNHYNTNIELALLNAYFIGKTLYPERFADVSIQDKAAELLERFLALNDLQEIPAYRAVRFPETGAIDWE